MLWIKYVSEWIIKVNFWMRWFWVVFVDFKNMFNIINNSIYNNYI